MNLHLSKQPGAPRKQGRAIEGPKAANQDADPIIVHPDIRRNLMEQKSFIEGSRAFIAWTAILLDKAKRENDKDSEGMASLLIPVIKGYITDKGFEYTINAQQVFGGHGYIEEWGMSQYARDARIAMIYEGTNGIQALDLVGRKFNTKNGQLLKVLLDELCWFDQHSPEGELKGWVAEWETYRMLMQECIVSLKKTGEAEGKDGYVLYAVNMLDLMGDVLCCFYLLKQAVSAQKKWKSMIDGTASQAELLEDNEEAQFYWNKLRTTEFYVWSVLPRALSNAKTIKNANLAPLSACL